MKATETASDSRLEEEIVGITFKMTSSERDKLKTLCKEDGSSMQMLLEEGLKLLMRKRGHEPIQGMPRVRFRGPLKDAIDRKSERQKTAALAHQAKLLGISLEELIRQRGGRPRKQDDAPST